MALPEDPAEYAAWEVKMLASVEEQKNLPPEQAIPKLGMWIYQLSLHTHTEKGDRIVFNTAHNLLLSIPGHAEWFGKEIKAKTDDKVNGTGLNLPGRREWHFDTLSQLQSPETVKVLGELLFDERDPWKGIPTDAPWWPSCNLAVQAIHNLGLENPPVKSQYPDPRNDLRTWQLWFEQVRAGTRTFSFKGDKTIYSLAGPVATALDPGEVRARSSGPAGASGGGTDAPSGSSKVPAWVALSLALVALLLAAKRAFLKRPA